MAFRETQYQLGSAPARPPPQAPPPRPFPAPPSPAALSGRGAESSQTEGRGLRGSNGLHGSAGGRLRAPCSPVPGLDTHPACEDGLLVTGLVQMPPLPLLQSQTLGSR